MQFSSGKRVDSGQFEIGQECEKWFFESEFSIEKPSYLIFSIAFSQLTTNQPLTPFILFDEHSINLATYPHDHLKVVP